MYGFDERETIIDEVVEHLLSMAHIELPPIEPRHIARRLRINVLERELEMRRGQCYVYRGMKFVDLARAGRTERRNFALAHEIMELELPPTIVEKQERHEISMRGAAALLCPARFFREIWNEGPFDLFRFKQCFSTASHEVIALRSLDFAQAIITVVDNGAVANRNTSYPFGVQPITPEELRVAARVMESGHTEVLSWENASVIAFPVFENGFKRIILRTVLDEAA